MRPAHEEIQGDAPFDEVAAQYDAEFTDTPLGKRQRAIVHTYLEGVVRPGMRVLELNCGTGHDAVWLAARGAEVTATDASSRMVEVASRKVEGARVAGSISFRQLMIEDLIDPEIQRELGAFDLILSNFDGLNCVRDLSPFPEAFTSLLRPKGHAILVFMNPICAMEIFSLLLRGRWRRALQRLRRDGLEVHIGNGIAMRTWFHPVGRTLRHFRRGFVARHVEAVGLITPPTLMRSFYHRHESTFRRFFPLEDLLASLPPFNRMGDHVLLHLQRRD